MSSQSGCRRTGMSAEYRGVVAPLLVESEIMHFSDSPYVDVRPCIYLTWNCGISESVVFEVTFRMQLKQTSYPVSRKLNLTDIVHPNIHSKIPKNKT
jgi:hypothetical protein